MQINVKLTAAVLVGAFALFAMPSHAYALESKSAPEAAKKQVIVEVKEGDTLSSIADANKTTYVRIFNANDTLQNPDVINAGDKLRIPADNEQLTDRYGQYMASAAAAKPAYNGTYTTRSYSTKPVNSKSYYVGNGMWCTDYVYSKRGDLSNYGNAGYNWISKAQAQGKSTGSTPQAGAVAVMNGHVAYVNSVNADGSYNVSEMGWNYQAGNYNERTVQPGTFGAFIY